MKKIIFCLTLAFMLLGSSFTSLVDLNVASAASSEEIYKFSKEDEKRFLEWYVTYGGDVKTAKELIKKSNNGIIWDSLKAETYENVPAEELQVSFEEKVKVYTFSDGSKYVAKMDFDGNSPTTESGIGIQSISGGSVTCGSGYCNYKDVWVEKDTFKIHMMYMANYTIVNGGYDYISSVWNQQNEVLGGTPNQINFAVMRSKETAGDDAYADYRVDISWWGGLGSSTCFLMLFVGGDSAYSSDNF